MDFMTSLQDTSSLQLHLGGRAVLWHPCSPLAQGHAVALSCCRWGSEPQASQSPVWADKFTKACSPPIHNNAHQHQTNKSCWETGAFFPIRVRWATPVFGMAEPEAAGKDSREGSPSAGFFLSFATAKSQRSRPQTSFDSCITHFQAALLLALALCYFKQLKPQNVLWVQKHSTANAR